MSTTHLPVLLDSNFQELRRLHPLRVGITQNLKPLSAADMELSFDDDLQLRQFVKLYTSHGTAGVFRVTAIQSSHGKTKRVSLSHGLCTLSDGMIAGEGEASGSARQLLEAILRPQSTWTLGTVDPPDDILLTWKWDNSNLLESLTDLMEQLPDYYLTFDQSTLPWKLHVLRLSDIDACECRLNRAMTGISIKEDDSELCTVLHVPGVAEPLQSDTMDTWGSIERTLSADPDLTPDLLLTAARVHLEEHKNPRLTITIDAVELAKRTQDPFDHFTCGTICRTTFDGYPGPIRQRIVRLHFPDIIGTPDVCKLTLSSEASTASTAIAGLVVDTTYLRNKVSGNSKKITLQADEIELLGKEIQLKASQTQVDSLGWRLNEVVIDLDAAKAELLLKASSAELNETQTRLSNAEIRLNGMDAAIALKANQAIVDEHSQRLSAAEIAIDGANAAILLKADRTEHDELAKRVSSAEIKVDGANAAIMLKADRTVTDELGTRVSAAEIAIDGVNSTIALKADKIDLLGYVTASQLETNYAKIADLNSVQAQITNLTGGLVTASVLRSTLFTGNQANFTFLTADAFNLGNELVQKKTISMGDVTSTGKALGIGDLTLDHSHEVTVGSDGKLKMGKATEEGSTFDLAATQFYKDGVAAATTKGAESLVFYAGGEEGVADLEYGTSLSITATTTRADGTALAKGILVKAPPDNYNTGWNECIQNANAFPVLINYYAAGENLYDSAGNLAPGPWYKGTQATRYSLPASKP